MKSLMILSSKDGDNINLEFSQVIDQTEKQDFIQKYASSPIGVFFFDIPEEERGALRLGLYQNAEELEVKS